MTGIMFEEEDTDDMLSFMEEYDEVVGEEEGKGDGFVKELELETIENPDGTFTFRPRRKAGDATAGKDSSKPKETAKEFLKSRQREGDAMTEDDWFDFLKRIGEMPDEGRTASPEKVAERAEAAAKQAQARRKTGGRYKFVDRIRVVAHGGKGGKGCISFEMIRPGSKRPSGGHGGQGGDVIFVADPRVQSLDTDRHHFHGKRLIIHTAFSIVNTLR